MWPEIINFEEDYEFKSSPEFYSENCFSPETMDISSGEDFITQLSTDLHIPLLVNPGEDELAVLSSIYDKSPDEILSDIKSPPREDIDIKDLDLQEWVLDNTKIEDLSDDSNSSGRTGTSYSPPPAVKLIKTPSKTTSIRLVTENSSPPKVPIKKVAIQPKNPSPPINAPNNFVVIKNEFSTVLPQRINGIAPNVVVLDPIPINTFSTSPITPLKPGPILTKNVSIDPKLLKRQQRKIKNRESACLSRKKKKDYVTSLEDKVKELEDENKLLKEENTQLKERLSGYEDTTYFNKLSLKNAKPAIVLCAFLLVVGINLDFLSASFSTKMNKVDLAGSKYAQIPSKHHSRGLLWTDETKQREDSNTTYFSPLTMCPASINQTESARLLLELERWIGKPEPEPPTPPPPFKPKLKPRRKKIRVVSPLIPALENRRYGPENESKNEIQVFTLKPEQLYSEFFEAINRQDDTFYVVSFSEQHLLVPALYHNKTQRPKMTLLMPSVLPNGTTAQSYVPLMQIDCEVLDTKLVHVKHGAIPRQYRNATRPTPPSDEERRGTNATKKNPETHAFKPYFLSKTLLKNHP